MTNLVKLLKLHIETNDVDQRKLASNLGMSQWELTRLLQGRAFEVKAFAGIMRWLAEDAK